MSIDEVKRLFFYGTMPDGSKVAEDAGSLDWAVMMMFKLLEERTIFNAAEVEAAFWKRLTAIAEHPPITP